ncbi:MAG: PH domain-containing protein [Anaerolineales bacterium]|nr:PH domain-containing protein [Anaerolineales bacterium]
MGNQREEVVAEFRRSTRTLGFWWRTIFTLSLYYWVLWRRNKITVTTRRVIQRTGNIVGGKETSIQLTQITDVTVSTGGLGTLLGYGLIQIQSAGSGASEISFAGIARPHRLKDIIFDLQDGVIDGGMNGETAKVEG